VPCAALLFLLAACAGPGQEASSEDGLGTQRVRVMAGNLSSGTRQSYDPGEGIRLFQGVRPDVALVQEMNFGANTDADARAFVDQAFGVSYAYVRESAGSGRIPNGVVSRFPIVASGAWTDASVSNRSFVWARLRVGGAHDLWAVSVHLLTSSQANRSAEATQLVSLLQQNVPAGDYVVVGGDFNTGSRAEPCLVSLSQLFDVAAPYPADATGNGNTSAARSKPYDWVLASSALRPYQTSVVIGASSFPAGLVLDSRAYSPLGEIAPVQQADSAATNMQHMGVVKDFLLPVTATPPGVRLTAPNGGESWAAGSTQTIAWQNGSQPVRIDLSLDDGASWSAIAASAPGPTYRWTVPATPSAKARVRVVPLSDATGSDASDGSFTIAAAPPAGDAFEPDDAAASARPIDVDGAAQTHDISPASDQDWVTFTLAAPRNVRIATDGPSGGDTFITLYDASLKQLGQDDDSGPGYYSLLSRAALPAGTYFVKVTSYNSASVIRGYSLRVTTY
jgi:endonuclease/exonuclease/phosphatase family metal-dependent hydrolase